MTDMQGGDRPLRILHLAFEDHRRPGSGGGGVRTHEINRRLARNHHVTTVVARYHGARRRTEDGVDYRPLGLSLGPKASMISYHLAVPWFVMRHQADVVIEDFAAPHSSDLVPLWTRSATVAVVQWLFAAQKSTQYRLPLWIMEATGVRLHGRFVAVSQYMAACIHDLNPEAVVDVVYAGVDPPPAPSTVLERRDLLCLGRLEGYMKGLDLLVDAFEEVARDWPDVRLRIAGDGPGESHLRRLLAVRGLNDRVDWLGRLEGNAKWDALQHAAVVLLPSRFETFGLVALEALGVGTPVVAFALPSLLEIIAGTESAVLVEPEDGSALGRAASDLLGDPNRRRTMSESALIRAKEFDWDQAALAHERIYRSAVTEQRQRDSRPSSRARLLLSAVRQLRHSRPPRRLQPAGHEIATSARHVRCSCLGATP